MCVAESQNEFVWRIPASVRRKLAVGEGRELCSGPDLMGQVREAEDLSLGAITEIDPEARSGLIQCSGMLPASAHSLLDPSSSFLVPHLPLPHSAGSLSTRAGLTVARAAGS